MSDTPENRPATRQLRSADALPRMVDVRRFIASDVTLSATEPLASFKRLGDMLEADSGSVEIQLHFFIDEQRFRRIDGAVQSTVMVLCQRCLQPMPVAIDSQFSVAAVWTEEEGESLPRHIDPYLVGEEPQDLRELIEDELIISVPFVSYHSDGPCAASVTNSEEAEPAQPALRENPFSVLGQLKPGKE